MPALSSSIMYIFLFIALYFQIFLLVTFFENKQLLIKERKLPTLKRHPSVTIIVPCFNEERTVGKTITSLLALNYPKNKLDIIVVDDGSSDNTFTAAQKFTNNPQVRIFRKENGGKYTALNLGLEHTRTDLVGCLDADSFVDADALIHIVEFFENPAVMAVTPTIKVFEPKNVLQYLQRAEYNMSIFLRKMFGLLNALHVTPGPFSIFRKRVFEELGVYKHAHNTEDMEIALRMHSHHYQIENSAHAFVYTTAPKTLYKLYRQRIRWVYGFLKNALDYKHMFFKKEFGNLGLLTLPAAVISIVSALYFSGTLIYITGKRIIAAVIKFQTVGFHYTLHMPSLDWFYLNTQLAVILAYFLFVITVFIVLTGKKMSEGTMRPSRDIIYFLALYGFIAPIWLAKAVFDVTFSRKNSWR